MPVTPTYVPLATITLTSTDSEVVFGSIPASYRDLIVVFQASSPSLAGVGVRLNGDTGSNYSHVGMDGPTFSFSGSGTSMNIGVTDSTLGAGIIQVLDYSATDKHKTVLARSGPSNYVRAGAGRWANTTAVNSVSILFSSASIGSTLSLYGIA